MWKEINFLFYEKEAYIEENAPSNTFFKNNILKH